VTRYGTSFQGSFRRARCSNDSGRLGSISAAVASIRKERDELRARVNAARDQAAFATGTDYDEYLTRDAKDAAMIKEYEQQMASGEKRTQEPERRLGWRHSGIFSRYFRRQGRQGQSPRNYG